MRKYIVSGLLAGTLGTVALVGTANAQVQAFTNSPVEVFAGPSSEYPLVAQLAPSQSVAVYGCLDGYSWCDVAVPGLRGWAYAGSLSYPYQGNYVPLIGYGAVLGLPIIGFSIGSYWDRYYRGRPWFNDRGRWGPPPGPGWRGGPPPGPHGDYGRPGGPPGGGYRPGPGGQFHGGPERGGEVRGGPAGGGGRGGPAPGGGGGRGGGGDPRGGNGQ